MGDNGKLTWANERRKLCELVPWGEHEDDDGQNPRQIRKDEARRLEDSLERFGQIQTIAIGPENQLYDGHQRRLVWAASRKFGSNYEVDVRVASRPLTEREREQLVVYLHRGTVGEWNYDLLAGFNIEDLLNWGFEEAELLGWAEDDDYTRRIEAPIYEPLGVHPPELSTLFDDTKTKALIDEADGAEGISEDEKEFLRVAAQRHTVLNFERTADYYAHASSEMQYLMENNALVIVDFDKAISLGFVRLSEKLAGMVRDEYGDE